MSALTRSSFIPPMNEDPTEPTRSPEWLQAVPSVDLDGGAGHASPSSPWSTPAANPNLAAGVAADLTLEVSPPMPARMHVALQPGILR